jgi:hypothetical protein
MRQINRIADRALSLVAPKLTASAYGCTTHNEWRWLGYHVQCRVCYNCDNVYFPCDPWGACPSK